LTNTGQSNLTLPISPHAGDFEPQDETQLYTVQHLHLYVTSNKLQDAALPGGADLYGNETHPNTLLTLLPGKSVRVLATFEAPKELTPVREREMLVIAHAVLDTETLQTVHGQTTLKSDEIGASSSPVYKMESP
jgi:hypothetical protein